MIRPAGGESYRMTAIMWLPPLTRALATALLVVFASALAESVGPFWGALVASLPVSAGPAYVFLAIQHDGEFVAASALSSLAANAATGLFLIVYGISARRAQTGRSLLVAVVAWLAAILVMRQIAWTSATAVLLNLVVYGAGFVLLRVTPRAQCSAVSATRRRWFDLPVRAATVALFVSFVVVASSVLGPGTTGIAAVFPVSLISLIVILQPRIGGPASSLLAGNALRSMLGFGMMLLVLHLAVRPWGVATALIASLMVSFLWSAGLLVIGNPLSARAVRLK
jgi:hypothetical protein